MDNRGMIFTLDAALALIPIFILLTAVANASDSSPIYSSHIRSIQNAQDNLDIMSSDTDNYNSNIIKNIADILIENNDSDAGINEAGKIAGYYLNKSIKNSNYCFMEVNQMNKTIVSNGDIKDAFDTSVGFKSCGNYIFKLYLWE